MMQISVIRSSRADIDVPIVKMINNGNKALQRQCISNLVGQWNGGDGAIRVNVAPVNLPLLKYCRTKLSLYGNNAYTWYCCLLPHLYAYLIL